MTIRICMHVKEVLKLDIIKNIIFINKINLYILNFCRTSIKLCKLLIKYGYWS